MTLFCDGITDLQLEHEGSPPTVAERSHDASLAKLGEHVVNDSIYVDLGCIQQQGTSQRIPPLEMVRRSADGSGTWFV